MADVRRFMITAGQIVQSVNFLPHKHEELSRNSQNYLNGTLGTVVHVHYPNRGCKWDRRISKASHFRLIGKLRVQ